MQDVSPAQLKLKDWIVQLHQLRHGSEASMPWPIEKGGSFLHVCQRAWSDMLGTNGVVNFSLEMLQKMGLAASPMTADQFVEKFATTQDPIVTKYLANTWFRHAWVFNQAISSTGLSSNGRQHFLYIHFAMVSGRWIILEGSFYGRSSGHCQEHCIVRLEGGQQFADQGISWQDWVPFRGFKSESSSRKS